MNRIYRLVWSAATGSFLPVPEFASARGKKSALCKRAVAATVIAMGSIFSVGAYAQVTPDVSLGAVVVDPETQQQSRVVQLFKDENGLTFAALTDDNSLFFTSASASQPEGVGDWKNVSADYDDTTHILRSLTFERTVTLQNGTEPTTFVEKRVVNINLQGPIDGNVPGLPPGVNPPAGNENYVYSVASGQRGKSGGDGFGVRICFFRCATIGTSGKDGQPGNNGPDNIYVMEQNSPSITTTMENLAGIRVVSAGGDGGKGGNTYGALPGRAGGIGGNGGFVSVDTNPETRITTSGTGASGIFAQSRSGTGGPGGTGYILSSGGSGGGANSGKRVEVRNRSQIDTLGHDAHAIFAQSRGGAAGQGGDSFGLYSAAGNSAQGGAGGEVMVNNQGVLTTRGERSVGIYAQSVGGTGGYGGDGGGLVASGGSGAPGGDSGAVSVTNSGSVSTSGQNADAIFAQSVGGGGGSGGSGGGLVALGGTGNAGGSGGEVVVSNSGVLQTRGNSSRGLFAQSLGGGGGNAASTSGLAAIGGSGGGGGAAGAVNMTNSGSITTSGDRSDAVFAQSIGGGGGNGASSGGMVSVGGSGSGGGAGGAVSVSLAGGELSTAGVDARGIFAQSVGGGGGNGGSATSGGAFGSVGIGGSGSAGSNGGLVTVDLSGNAQIETLGDRATGVFAQSVGGGGGSGGGAFSAAIGAGGAASVAVGGRGGAGGQGGAVTLKSTGGTPVSIATGRSPTLTNRNRSGDDAAGVLLQSVGGGGGQGGYAIAIAASGPASGSPAGALALALGGSGGEGGQGGQVTVGEFDSFGRPTASGLNGNVDTHGDRATGVALQSIGGGGGNGGLSMSVAAAASPVAAAGISIGVGGSGGEGGHGGNVTAALATDITTRGAQATGLLAQSIGGGGGNGGAALSGAIALGGQGAGTLGLSLGGDGEAGGNGGEVKLWTGANTDITTSGLQSIGVLAQSVGGGGGSGGMAISTSAALSQQASASFGFGLGGHSSTGGNSASVFATVQSAVSTTAAQSAAVVAQSVGGGGGNGGASISGTTGLSMNNALGASMSVGGSGGKGGNAGNVTLETTNAIETLGEDAAGVVAQSIGGGGGNGAMNMAASLSLAKASAGSLSLGVGGSGGEGGQASAVTQTVKGDVSTQGARSTAVLAQSLGGGGGQGGFNVSGALNLSGQSGASLGVGIGGFGGEGGQAGSVNTVVGGSSERVIIATTGSEASGVVAQSIGGGGGQGGINVTGSMALSTSDHTQAHVGVGIGGFGGMGGSGASVSTTVNADITATGHGATGVLAQSIGGGGGAGAINVTSQLGLNLSGSNHAAAMGVGGFGQGGGNADAVSVNFAGSINTRPTSLADLTTLPVLTEATSRSDGLTAQSVGGGGGRGGFNISGGLSYTRGSSGAGRALVLGVGGFGGQGGDAGAVNVQASNVETIHAYGDGSSAVLASSIGGGGGDGGFNVSGGVSTDASIVMGVGGFGGNGGKAKDVSVHVNGALSVLAGKDNNQDGAGIKATSIGGGGGSGGLNMSSGLITNKGASEVSVTLGIGGAGGTGQTSGAVTVNQSGSIITSGGQTHGILAQSLAGGGGNGGLNVSKVAAMANPQSAGGYSDVTAVVGLGGHGGSGAHAERVLVTSTGNIQTHGDNARGILSQSLGGGGGMAGLNGAFAYTSKSSPMMVAVGGFGGNAGHGNEVTVNRGDANQAAGLIQTFGTSAHGIDASSIGGGGGHAKVNVILGWTGAGGGDAQSGSGSGSGSEPAKTHPSYPGIDAQVFTNYDAVIAELSGRKNAKEAPAQDPSSSNPSGFAAQIAIGGAGGTAGNGDRVAVNNFGSIQTEHGHGIIATSVGGGGGNASLNIGLMNAGAKGSSNRGLNLGIGGSPQSGGDGGEVIVNSQGDVSTASTFSVGVLAQSIGGGGGNADLTLVNSDTNGGKLNLTLGRSGGTGGTGGSVSLASEGVVTTAGFLSYGLLAQSVGNGGGNSSTSSAAFGLPNTSDLPVRSTSLSVGLGGGEGGAGGQVTMNVGGAVGTSGESAHAVFAQSVGGGGGNGGSAGTIVYKNGIVGLAVGGAGGQGGTGGQVQVNSSANVSTLGKSSVGVLAQSVGGGGGSGGMASAIGGQNKGSTVAINVGGGGGKGMTGGSVAVRNTGRITTQSEDAHGVLAQSIGGGGGRAGTVLTMIANTDSEAATQIIMAVGGTGGKGGDGGTVDVANDSFIETFQTGSSGILAQSLGGGGGEASQLVQGVATASHKGTKVNLGLGATGGEGGAGGAVSVTNTAGASSIRTHGDDAIGVLAMSIGGGGGLGSSVYNTSLSKPTGDDSESHSVTLSLGGSGGEGGIGGAVGVSNNGSIHTSGKQAHGVFALSLGGGGGNGGMSFAGDFILGARSGTDNDTRSSAFSIGGQGGDGNIGGAVNVVNTGHIQLDGRQSRGISAQSVGGGGGNGALAVSANASAISLKAPTVASLLNVGLGGSGGDGADGGNVNVRHQGSIVSTGADSVGIFAQSIGGGGGSARSAITSPVWMAADMAYEAVIGNRDGGTGEVGIVDVEALGDIFMLGDNSRAELTQSINGGGGELYHLIDISRAAVTAAQGGFDLPENQITDNEKIAQWSGLIDLGGLDALEAFGQKIQINRVGDTVTTGENSVGSMTQSIGAGGGMADLQIRADDAASLAARSTIGGRNALRSSAGDIVLSRQGLVSTKGAFSSGSLVQSIGGGGGVLNLTTTRTNHDATETAANPGTGRSILAAGGTGGTGNHGGSIKLDYEGDVLTNGGRAAGIVIQSLGGGGGQAHLSGMDSVSLGLGGREGAEGSGGNIDLSNTGLVRTEGTLSHGIVLQSIGGGGGWVSTDLAERAISFERSAANSGNGGNVRLLQQGDVLAMGERAIGVLAQSVGGGGGIVDRVFMGASGGLGEAGAIDVDLQGSVLAVGSRGVGVFLQSMGKQAGDNITLNLAAEQSVVFGGAGVGVWLSGGRDNSVTNRASILGIDGVQGMAVLAEGGNDDVRNEGLIEGNVSLGGGLNRLHNAEQARFYSGKTVDVGLGNLFTTDGYLAPGRDMVVQRTDITGNFRQGASGIFAVDLDFTGDQRDQLVATGQADVQGRVVINPMNTRYVRSGKRVLPLVTTSDGVSEQAQLIAPRSAVATYGLAIAQSTILGLDVDVDFSPSKLNRNQTSVGDYFNKVQATGGTTALAPYVEAIFAMPEVEQVATIYNRISPEPYATQQTRRIASSHMFASRLQSCKVATETFSFVEEGECSWVHIDNGSYQANATDQRVKEKGHIHSSSTGAQRSIGQGRYAGFGFGFERESTQGNGGLTRADDETMQIGMVLKRIEGPQKLSLAVNAGFSNRDSSRKIGLVDSDLTARASGVRTSTLSTHVRWSHDIQPTNWYVRRVFDFGVNYVHLHGFKEQDAGALNLHVPSQSDIRVLVQPRIEVGAEIPLRNGTILRPYANAGFRYDLTSHPARVKARLEGAESETGLFTVAANNRRGMGTIEAGADVLFTRGQVLRVGYTGEIGDKTRSSRLMLKYSAKF